LFLEDFTRLFSCEIEIKPQICIFGTSYILTYTIRSTLVVELNRPKIIMIL